MYEKKIAEEEEENLKATSIGRRNKSTDMISGGQEAKQKQASEQQVDNRDRDTSQDGSSQSNGASQDAPSKRAEPKLSVVLPTSQKSLVTPTIVTTSDLGAPITPTSHLFSSLVQINGQDAVGLFTGLPSCTPTSADSLAATSSLTGINPFFWGVPAFANDNALNSSPTAQKECANGDAHGKGSAQVGSSEPPGQRGDQQASADKQKADRCQLSKLSFDQLQAASAILHSPLSFFLSPERIRFGLQNQHPLQVNGAQNGSLPEHAPSGQASFARSPVDPHHQQQVRFAAQELTNQVVAHQQSCLSGSATTPSKSSELANPAQTTSNQQNVFINCPTQPNTYLQQQQQQNQNQRAPHNHGYNVQINSSVEQNSHQQISNSNNNISNNHSKQLINSLPHSNIATYQQFAAQQSQIQAVRNGIINQGVPGQLVYHHYAPPAPMPINSQSSILPNQPTTLSVSNYHTPNQTHTVLLTEPRQAQAGDLADIGSAYSGTVCAISHEASEQHPQLEPPAAHHNRDQYQNQLHSHQQNVELASANNRTTCQPASLTVHYENGQPIGLYNPHLRQLYLTQHHQHNYNVQHQHQLHQQQQQQPLSYQETTLKPNHINQHQVLPYQQSPTTTTKSQCDETPSVIQRVTAKPSNDTLPVNKESISSSSSHSCSVSHSPDPPDQSDKNKPAQSGENSGAHSAATTVPFANRNSLNRETPTNDQNNCSKKHLSKSKKQSEIHKKDTDNYDGPEVPVKKKSKGGRKKKQVTHEELMARKNRSKERNRVAAKRCRQKRKQFLDELCGRIDNLNELSKRLQKENTTLKNELELWKQRHKSCDV